MARAANPAMGTMGRAYVGAAEDRSVLAGWPEIRESKLLRAAAVSALMGTLLLIASGLGFGDLTREMGAEPVLDAIALQSAGTWGLVHLGFVLGALLWVVALVALSASRTLGPGTGLAWIASAVLLVGASLYAMNAFVSGFGLGALAEAWANSSAPDRDGLRVAADAMLPIVAGTWIGVITLFHGLPFVLFGYAVVRSRCYPSWLGWAGMVGGLGSFVIGAAMMLDTDAGPGRAFVPFALLVSGFMAVLGWQLWRQANEERRDDAVLDRGDRGRDRLDAEYDTADVGSRRTADEV